MTITIGSVPYLNEKPLTRWFTHTDDGRACGIRVIYEVPSKLADMLAAGEIDAALVSSFEYFRTPGYEIIPGVSISGQDEILSVRAFSRLPWRMIETVSLDTSSLTSSALLKIILSEVFNSHPAYLNHEPDLEKMLAATDAALLIGDKGMLAAAGDLHAIDLGSAWRRHTGLPFVYAVWLARPGETAKLLSGPLSAARDWGLTQLETVAAEQAERLNCPGSLCLRYLNEIMDYGLGEEHLQALALFGGKARSNGLLAVPPSIGPAVMSAMTG